MKKKDSLTPYECVLLAIYKISEAIYRIIPAPKFKQKSVGKNDTIVNGKVKHRVSRQ